MKLNGRKIDNIYIRDIEKSLKRYVQYFVGDEIIAKYMGLTSLYIQYPDKNNQYRVHINVWIDHEFDADGMGEVIRKSVEKLVFKYWDADIDKNKVNIIDRVHKLDRDRNIKVSIGLNKDELLKIFALARLN